MFTEVDMTIWIIFFLVLMLTYVCFRKPAGIPPGPALTFPVLGDLPQFAITKDDTIGILRKLRNKYGKIYSFYIGRQLTIVVSGYSMIYTAAAVRGWQFCGRPQNYRNKIFAKGRGIVFASGNAWKKQRQFASNALLKLGMKNISYEKHIIREVKALTEFIYKQRDKPFDIKTCIHASTAKVIFTSIIGKRKQIDRLVQSFIQLVEAEARLLPRVSTLLNCLPFLKYIPGDPLELNTIQNKFQTFQQLVKEHVVGPVLNMPPKEAATFAEMYIEKIKERENLGNETVFTFDQMDVVLRDILSAGCQTVPVTIRWAVLFLVNFPDIQERLQQELDEAIPAEKMPSLDDKVKLPYVDAFIAEVQRCANILPLGVPRAEINGNNGYLEGYFIPKDAAIMFDFDSIFMDSEIFGHPEIFNPNRFIDETGAFETPKEFIPFSVGRRSCINMQLAKWMLFLYMTNLIRTFTFLPADSENVPKIRGSFGGVHEPEKYIVRCVRRV